MADSAGRFFRDDRRVPSAALSSDTAARLRWPQIARSRNSNVWTVCTPRSKASSSRRPSSPVPPSRTLWHRLVRHRPDRAVPIELLTGA